MRHLIKLAVFPLLLCSAQVFAACGYTDRFHFEGMPDAMIQSLSDSANLTATKTSVNQFELTTPTQINPENNAKTCLGDSDTATVQIGIDALNYCSLRFRDGPFMTDPLVEDIRCKGNFHYAGLTYDGYLTYRYTIHFN